MSKILVTYALQEELAEILHPTHEFYYLRTGVGKVRSTYYVSNALKHINPDLVINMGSAGTHKHKVGDLFVCSHFIDRDMEKLAAFGLNYQIDSSALLKERNLCQQWGHAGLCNTGDSFVTEHSEFEGDIIDMEAYAQAFVCEQEKIPFISVKYVTDIIGQNSVKVWEERLAEAKEGLRTFFNETLRDRF